jgi:hypothetical protein
VQFDFLQGGIHQTEFDLFRKFAFYEGFLVPVEGRTDIAEAEAHGVRVLQGVLEATAVYLFSDVFHELILLL